MVLLVWAGLPHMCGASAGICGTVGMARISLDMILSSRRLAWTHLHGGLRFPAARERASPIVQVLLKSQFASHLQTSTGQSKSSDQAWLQKQTKKATARWTQKARGWDLKEGTEDTDLSRNKLTKVCTHHEL